MADDERTQPIAASDPIAANDAPEAPSTGDDTEGHSMGLLLGVNTLGRTSSAERSRSKQPADEDLPPLSKKWPSMRDEKKA